MGTILAEKKMMFIPKRYYCKFVAFVSFGDHTIVASGKDRERVRTVAAKRGYPKAIIFFAGPPWSHLR